MRPRHGPRTEPGQVLVIVTLALTVLLAFAGVAIDIGRQVAERRHVQTAADAAALAACRALIAGDSDGAAAAQARTIGLVNLEHSPADADALIAPDIAPVYESGHAGDPAYLKSGIIISGTTVRVAIDSSLETYLARLVGVMSMETGARARCQLSGGPTMPIVARRYESAPGPGSGFVDFLATAATSADGAVDATNVMGYDGRTPASEAQPGPDFELYGPNAKASNDNSFRGFVALDVRNFQSTTSRVYYNGVTPGTTVNTLKTMEGDYIINGYNGPMFPPVTQPADPNDQVAILSGNDTNMVLGNFSQVFVVGDRILLAAYSGTTMEIPDFSITPPSAITLASTTSSPVSGPNFTVSRNAAFSSTVTLFMHGDHVASPATSDLIPDEPPTNAVPTAGHMNQPVWSTDVFIPAQNGTTVAMQNISTDTIPAGIYTVWLEGQSGNPYFQTRRYPVPVKVGGAVRDFSFANSTASGTISSLGGTTTLPMYVSTTNASGTKWGATGSAVTLSVDVGSFTDCSLAASSIGAGQLTFSAGSVTPSASGSGALSNLTINSFGLAPGCYRFVIRGTGTNGSSQPVTHLMPVTFTVATSASAGTYVDIIGFTVFEVTGVSANSFSGHAISAVAADGNDPTLRSAQAARLSPW